MTDYIDKPFQPGMTSDTYTPDQLIAGNLKLVTDTATITGGGAYLRGTVLGQVTIAAATVAPKAGGNTGNGTVSAVTAGAHAKPGPYSVRFTGPTAFEVQDPNGDIVEADGATGNAVAGPVGFTITAGATAFVAGDGFVITVAAGSGSYKPAVATALDGSAEPAAILVDFVDTTLADQQGGIYEMGEFNANAITLDPSIPYAVAKSALQRRGIFLRTSVSAADPIIPN